jgi:hypothetical protein
MSDSQSCKTVAYLVSVHQHPQQFARLVRALDHPGVHFFVHVDQKTPSRPFAYAVGSSENVSFCRERFNVNRKGWSQVASTLELMRTALPGRFRYYCLLSGADYPLRNAGAIVSFFQHTERQYISYFRVADLPSWHFKISKYHYRDDAALVRQTPRTTSVAIAIGVARLRHLWRRLRMRVEGARRAPRVTVYGGSQWWSLTHDCVDYLLGFVDSSPSFVGFFRYTDSPVEMFFQTAVLNSPLARTVSGYDDFEIGQMKVGSPFHPWPEERLNLRYIDWRSDRWTGHNDGTGLRGPAVLDARDASSLAQSTALFARKFDPVRSDALLSWIDRELLGVGHAD